MFKKKFFELGDRVILDTEVYTGEYYDTDYVMTVVEINTNNKWLKVEKSKNSFGGTDRNISGHWKYFKLAFNTDPITGERLNV